MALHGHLHSLRGTGFLSLQDLYSTLPSFLPSCGWAGGWPAGFHIHVSQKSRCRVGLGILERSPLPSPPMPADEGVHVLIHVWWMELCPQRRPRPEPHMVDGTMSQRRPHPDPQNNVPKHVHIPIPTWWKEQCPQTCPYPNAQVVDGIMSPKMSTSRSPGGGWNNVLKDVHTLIPRALECVMLGGKWDFAGEITIQDPQMVPTWG